MGATITLEKTFSVIYQEIKKLNDESVYKFTREHGRLNSKGKQYFVFPILKDAGYDSWEKIHNEIVLISEQKSTQSKTVRDALITTYYQVTKNTIELNNQNKK